MQYNSVYYHDRNLNVEANSFSWNLSNGDANYRGESGYNVSVPRYANEQYLGYEKEMLRQTMQNHEATFRYQVQELHRLHSRQRELMCEKWVGNIFMENLQLQTPLSNLCMSQAQSEISHVSHPASWLVGRSPENIQGPLTVGEENFRAHMTFCPGPVINNSEVTASSSGKKGLGKRILGLELASGVFYNDEKCVQFEKGNASEAPELACGTHKMLKETQPAKDSLLGFIEKGDTLSVNISSCKTKFLIDLNEPVHLESQNSSSSPEFMQNGPHISEEMNSDSLVPKHCGLVNCEGRSNGPNSSMNFDLNFMPFSCLSETAISVEDLSVNKDTKDRDSEQKAHSNSTDELLAFTYSSEDVEKGLSLDCMPTHDHTKPKSGLDDRFLKTKTCIDLNVDVGVDEPCPPLETGLEAPVSPENKEGSRPIGESEDIPVEMSILSEQDKLSIAAKTLVMIFDSGIQEHLKAAKEPRRILSSTLCWFAEIVSTGNDRGELELDETDNYGARTMKLSTRKEKTSTSRPKRGSVKRKVRKNSKLSHSDAVKKSTTLVLKQPNKHAVLQDWGNRKRRRGGRRKAC